MQNTHCLNGTVEINKRSGRGTEPLLLPLCQPAEKVNMSPAASHRLRSKTNWAAKRRSPSAIPNKVVKKFWWLVYVTIRPGKENIYPETMSVYDTSFSTYRVFFFLTQFPIPRMLFLFCHSALFHYNLFSVQYGQGTLGALLSHTRLAFNGCWQNVITVLVTQEQRAGSRLSYKNKSTDFIWLTQCPITECFMNMSIEQLHSQEHQEDIKNLNITFQGGYSAGHTNYICSHGWKILYHNIPTWRWVHKVLQSLITSQQHESQAETTRQELPEYLSN